MLVVLKEPFKSETQETIAVNITTHDHIDISKFENKFHLALRKFYDGHHSSHSSMYTFIATFESYNECIALFDQIIDAMKEGKQVLDLREDSTSSILQSEEIPTV